MLNSQHNHESQESVIVKTQSVPQTGSTGAGRRLYSDKEIGAILKCALELQQVDRRSDTHTFDRSYGISLDELQQIAAEVGTGGGSGRHFLIFGVAPLRGRHYGFSEGVFLAFH